MQGCITITANRRQAADRCARRVTSVPYAGLWDGALSMSAIARELGLSVSRVSRLIARTEGAKDKA